MFERQQSSLQRGRYQEVYVQRPIANLAAVLNPFWDEYANRREIGMDTDEAVDKSLALLLPSDQVDEVIAMLRGELDQQLSEVNPFDGRELKLALLRPRFLGQIL